MILSADVVPSAAPFGRCVVAVLALFGVASAAVAQQQYSIGQPSNDQQYMLELTNRARANADAEANRLGMTGGRQEGPPSIDGELWTIQNTTQPLSWNPQLASAAQNHSKTLNDADHIFTGTSPHEFGGTTPEQRIAAAGYPAAPYNGETTSFGAFPGPENVAEAVSRSSAGPQPYTGAKLTQAVVAAHNGLFSDNGMFGGNDVPGRGHRNTMTLTFFRETGVGITTGSDNGQGFTWDSFYLVQNFGSQTNALPFITGVVYNDANGNNFYDPGEGIGGVRVDVSGANFFAISSSSGGYSVPVPGNGSYTVNFSGGSLPAVQRSATIAGNLNTKLDYVAAPTVQPAAVLANISTRMRVETDDNVLIAGFIVAGAAPKKVILRGIGPSIGDLPAGAALQNPTLELFQGDTSLGFNDNWKDAAERAEIEASTIPPSNDMESAIVRTLSPGVYTAVMRGQGNTTGVGLVELYDLNTTADSKLANIATRGRVQTGGNIMIAGMIVTGESGSSQRVIIRAIGPSLTVAGKLQNPALELIDGNGTVLRANNDWRTDQQTDIQATGVAPGNDLESALIHTLPPGRYTATVRGVSDGTGIAVVEIYALSN